MTVHGYRLKMLLNLVAEISSFFFLNTDSYCQWKVRSRISEQQYILCAVMVVVGVRLRNFCCRNRKISSQSETWVICLLSYASDASLKQLGLSVKKSSCGELILGELHFLNLRNQWSLRKLKLWKKNINYLVIWWPVLCFAYILLEVFFFTFSFFWWVTNSTELSYAYYLFLLNLSKHLNTGWFVQ